MEKGDIYGLVGMCLGIGALTDMLLYFLYVNLPFSPALMAMLMMIIYITVIISGMVGIILSLIGISKNQSKFGFIGVVCSALALVLFMYIVFY